MITTIINRVKCSFHKPTGRKLLSPLLSGIIFSGLCSLSFADDRYISDKIYISLHSEKSLKSRSLSKGLVSGTKVTFKREEVGTDNNLWSLVTTADGTEGWVRSQNLSSQPTAALVLAGLPNATRNALTLETENKELSAKLAQLEREHEKLLADTEDMRQAATTALNLEEDNKRIHTEYQLLQTHADVLKAENDQLHKKDSYNQWLYGAGLMLLGIILSFILQGLGGRKRKSEWR